uniref:C-type lectin domain-containing protein n=1 Tax=Paramormyrops kingsleyae TaxID=1676925 RepID=A0A3B3SSG2_9TELE
MILCKICICWKLQPGSFLLLIDEGLLPFMNCPSIILPSAPDNLILVNRTMTWNEALNYCRTHHSDLVSVHNEEIQYWVSRRAEKASTDHVWLGLRFSCYLNLFWISAENVRYQNWAPNNIFNSNLCGTTGAVQSKDPHYWVSLPETKELNFICTKYPTETV